MSIPIKECEVLHEGQWYPGDLFQWSKRADGSWWALVRYRVSPGLQYQQSRPADQVRPSEEGRALQCLSALDQPLKESCCYGSAQAAAAHECRRTASVGGDHG